jgi:hypothetical protein
MGLGKFLSKATKAVGHVQKTVTKTAEHAVTSAAKDGGHAAKNAASGAAVAAGKGLQSATKTVGKVGVGKFNVANASKTLTHAGIGDVSLAGASNALKKGISKVAKIPILGPIVGVVTPIHIINAANNFANGQRVDRAAISVLNNKIKDYKDVAPYAASVVSFVPAVGPGVGASIAAAAALADGKHWDQIAIEAAKGAIPGGNIAKAAFDVATAAAQGKPIDQIALAAIPLDPKVKQAITAGLALTKDLAAGKRVDASLLARVNDALNIAGIKGNAATAITSGAALAKDLASGKPVDKALIARVDDAIKLAGPAVGKALQVGTAIGTAKKLQDGIMKQIGSPDALNALHDMGTSALKDNKVLQQGLKMSSEPMFKKGFAVASGVMSGKKVTEAQLLGIRNALDAEGKKGFDAATSYFIGKHSVNKKPLSKRNPPPKVVKTTRGLMKVPPKKANEAQSFAYFATHGLAGAGAQQKEVLIKKLAEASPEMREGTSDAIRAIAADRKLSPANRTFVQNMKAWLTAPEKGRR